MQCVVADWKASAGHVPEVPVQLSATSHWPAEARHVTVAASYTSTQTLHVPVQLSAASSSHTPPSDVPMQCVVADWKASAGHVPEVPVQLSATSHWPAEARQVTVAASYTSTQTLLVPVQWSAGSSSHTPPSDVPMQCVVADWKASAGHVPDRPVQRRVASECPAEARRVTVADWDTSTQTLPAPVQESGASSPHTPPP